MWTCSGGNFEGPKLLPADTFSGLKIINENMDNMFTTGAVTQVNALGSLHRSLGLPICIKGGRFAAGAGGKRRGEREEMKGEEGGKREWEREEGKEMGREKEGKDGPPISRLVAAMHTRVCFAQSDACRNSFEEPAGLELMKTCPLACALVTTAA